MSVRNSSNIFVDDSTPSRFLHIKDLQIGDTVSQEVIFTNELKAAFQILANDNALVHSNAEFASAKGFQGPIIQGLCITARFSRLIGMYLPGEEALIESLDFKFRKPIYFGRSVNFHVKITRILSVLRVVRLGLVAESDGVLCVEGVAQCVLRPIK
jgi:acyl dehydratase